MRRFTKVAKKLLKARPQSLRLYNVYAIGEFRFKNVSAANKVFSTTISMSSTLLLEVQAQSILLWRSWIWEHLRIGQITPAKQILARLGDDSLGVIETLGDQETLSYTSLLKAQQYLKEGRDGCLARGQFSLAVLFIETAALFDYFRESFDHAMSTFQSGEDAFSLWNLDDSMWHQLLSQAKAQLIDLHLDYASTYQPAHLRELVLPLIKKYPNNTLLLGLLSEIDSRFALNDRVRSALTGPDFQTNPMTHAGWLYQLRVELLRSKEVGGTVHTVRATFEKAVKSKP